MKGLFDARLKELSIRFESNLETDDVDKYERLLLGMIEDNKINEEQIDDLALAMVRIQFRILNLPI